MKRIVSFLIKIVALILVILLLVTFSGEISGFLRSLLPDAERNTVITTTQVSHELRNMGMLVVSEYTDTGTFVATLPALIIKEAQRVTVPYAYAISFGVDLEKATIHADDHALFVTLPPAEMTHDKLTVTGKVEVQDFLYPLTEARYQQILDEQTDAFRNAYLEDPSVYVAAQEMAEEKVAALLQSMLEAQGEADAWSLIFVPYEETVPAPAI